MYTSIKAVLTRPSIEEWLTPLSRQDVEYRKKWLNRMSRGSVLGCLPFFFTMSLFTLPLLLVSVCLFLYLSLDRNLIVRCYEYLSESELLEMEQAEPEGLVDMLKGISKKQGFLMRGQVSAARYKYGQERKPQLRPKVH